MRKVFLSGFIVMFSALSAIGQEKANLRDTTTMPKLEIPEITIVGKKAITLPFARKGEVYDVELYEVPPPDTSLLEERFAMALPLGPLPRYNEPLLPWHFSAQGSFGSFSTVNVKVLADYKGKLWGIYGNTSLSSTKGHTENAECKYFDANINAHSLINTDNSILQSFRMLGGVGMIFEKYGMYGIKEINVDRSRNNILLHGGISSLERDKNAYDVHLSADIWSVSDNDSSTTLMSPELSANYALSFARFLFSAGLSYSGTSLNYKQSTESPSLLSINVGIRWNTTEKWSIEAGGEIYDGSGSDRSGKTLLSPFVIGRLEIDKDRQLSVWFKPEMSLYTYGELIKLNPYIIREFILKPESAPIKIGGGFWFNGEILSLELNGEFSKISDKSILISEDSQILLQYVDAIQVIARIYGTFTPQKNMRITFSGIIQPTYEEGNSVQLSMIPLIKSGVRGELFLNIPLRIWSSVEYWSEQNIDLISEKDIGARFLVEVGASTQIIPRTILSAEIRNLLDDRYEWWNNYIAPGISFRLKAKINFL